MTGPDVHVESRLRPWLDGELPAAEAERVRAHTEACPGCARAAAELRELRTLIRADAALPSPGPLWPGVRERLRPRLDPRRRFAYAAGVSALAAAGLFLGLHLGASAPAAPTGPPAGTWETVSPVLGGGTAGNLTEVYLAAETGEGDR